MTFSLIIIFMRIVCQIFDRKELVDIENILVILEYTDLNREFFLSLILSVYVLVGENKNSFKF